MVDNDYSLFHNKYAYNGNILKSGYSNTLKNKIIETIIHMTALEKIGAPIIPYIAAWESGGGDIWYEYVGERLRQMLGKKAARHLAEKFRDNLSNRYSYRKSFNTFDIVKDIYDKKQIGLSRQFMRRMVEKQGSSDAIYKLDVSGETVWLKDLACVETYEQGRIVLSLGSLIDVTNEVRLEESLNETQKELEYHKKNLELLVEERTHDLHKTQLEVIKRLAYAAEFRDGQTGSHNRRLSIYCSIIGRSYGLLKGANWLLYHAVPMHDLGKLGIADSILLKKGSLTSKEYEIIKGHCEMGGDLLKGNNSKLLEFARAVALTHHEHWDGSGYPTGMPGKKIPLVGRIVAICDVFDALTTQRPYKEAWEFDEAVKEIQRLNNIFFDPQIVNLFIQNLSAIRKVYDHFSKLNEKFHSISEAI
jgi:HD-GYP domain-containing protein (c-di-GMP phosphodiesterase class II)